MAIPATREYNFEITVPLKTAKSAPLVENTRFAAGEVVKIEVVIPGGSAGLVGFAIASSKQPIIPLNAGAFIIGDAEPFTRDLEGYPNSGDWQVFAYNEDIYAHSLQVRFSVKEIPPRPHEGVPILRGPLSTTPQGTLEVPTGEQVPGEGEGIGPVSGEEIPPGEGITEPPPGLGGGEEPPPAGGPEEPAPEEPPPGEVPGLGEFGGEEPGGPTETEPGEISLGTELEAPIAGEAAEPSTAAPAAKPKGSAKGHKKKKAKPKPKPKGKPHPKRKKPAHKKPAAHRHPAKKKPSPHKRSAGKKAPPKKAAKRSPTAKKSAVHRPAPRRAPRPPAHPPKPKPKPKPKPPPPKPKPKPPPPPPKRKAPPPPPKRKHH